MYADLLVKEGYCGQTIGHVLTHSTPGIPSPTLLKLGFKAGHCIKIAMAFVPPVSSPVPESSRQILKVKIPRPTLALNIDQVDFDQFKFEWSNYRMHYNISGNDIASQLLYCGNEEVRHRIRIEKPTFITPNHHTESELLDVLKSIVLSKVSSIVHVKQFHDLYQKTGESCSEFLSRLQTKASCCSFECRSCSDSNASQRIKEQFIIGLENEKIHQEILKTESVHPGTSLQQLLAEAVTLEQSIKDQTTLRRQSDRIYSFDSNASSSKEIEEVQGIMNPYAKQSRSSNPCAGCGSLKHGSLERQNMCPAWGKRCFNCNTMNHFQKHCRSKRSDGTSGNQSAQMLEMGMTCLAAGVGESSSIIVQVQSNMVVYNHLFKRSISAVPDTGANVCLIGPLQLKNLGIPVKSITSQEVKIKVVGGTHIVATGRFQAVITLNNRKTNQTIYFSHQVSRFYLSKPACVALGIVSTSFPHPPESLSENKSARVTPVKQISVPFEATYKEPFASSALNASKPFPKLLRPHARIHLKPGYIIPKLAYRPATVAYHWAENAPRSVVYPSTHIGFYPQHYI